MEASYKLLSQTPSIPTIDPEEDIHDDHSIRCCKRCSSHKILKRSLVILLILNILLLTWNVCQQQRQPQSKNFFTSLFSFSNQPSIPSDYARVSPLKTIYSRFWWNTAYSTPNRTSNNAHWDAILPSHGIVAVDKHHAESMGWPRSLPLPSDGSKMTYLLEAYHQIHCLRILRKTFWEAVDGLPFTHQPSQHMEHCFDTLRQSVQCYADNTPLYSFGDFTAGNGQLHQCRDWDQLRDWATEHTACYRDSVEGIPLGEHFGFCDDGDDGVGKIDEGVLDEAVA